VRADLGGKGMKYRAVLVVVVCALVLAACDWSMVGYDGGNTGFNLSEPDLQLNNISSLAETWRAPYPVSSVAPSRPVVAAGSVFVGRGDGTLYVYPERGPQGCSGTPTVCQPSWTAATGAPIAGSPAVVGGLAYVSSADALRVFDAYGKTSCSGTPKVCAPLWTTSRAGGSPVVANDVVYVSSGANLAAFDARGQTECRGVPKVCQPLWTAGGGTGVPGGPPAVVNGKVYVSESGGPDIEPFAVWAFDAAGNTGCAGTPKYCLPIATYQPTCSNVFDLLSCGLSAPVVSAGKLFVAWKSLGSGLHFSYALDVFDAEGVVGCTTPGAWSICKPIWSAADYGQSAPGAAGKIVFANGDQGAFDANGVTSCVGASCGPMWSNFSSPQHALPAIANGVLFGGDTQQFVTGVDDALWATKAGGPSECNTLPSTCRYIPLPHGTFGENNGPVVANGAVYVTTPTELRVYRTS
jgi:PQQ-like domain